MLVSVLFAELLFLLLGVTSTSRAVLISVPFADVLFLLLGVTRAVVGLLLGAAILPVIPQLMVRSAVLIGVLFADLLFLLLGGTSARFDPGRSVRNVEVMRVHGAW